MRQKYFDPPTYLHLTHKRDLLAWARYLLTDFHAETFISARRENNRP